MHRRLDKDVEGMNGGYSSESDVEEEGQARLPPEFSSSNYNFHQLILGIGDPVRVFDSNI